MRRHWGVVGVPSSAGAHTPGLEKGPAALRAAGLIDGLRQAGHQVDDHGDVPAYRWRPDPEHPSGQNPSAVARVADDTATAVASVAAAGQVPFVLGGDCSITIGAMAGLARAGQRPALLYLDGGPDLYTPRTRPNGNFDAMVMAHLLAIPGHVPEVAGVGPTVDPRTIVNFGHTLGAGDPELALMDQLDVTHVHVSEIHTDALSAARQALAIVEAAAPTFLLHFDVDALLFREAPFADVPDSGGDPEGLALAEMEICVRTFTGSTGLAGMVLTEVNPDHVPDPGYLADFVARLTSTTRTA